MALVRALASVAVALHHYRSDIAFLEADARASSRATQQSERAAHASAFVAYLLVAAMQRFDASKANEEGEYDWSAYDAREDRRAEMCGGVMTESLTFLTDIAEEYEERLEETDRATQASANPASSHAVHSLRRLLRASEPEGSPDQCWNWRGPQLVLGGSVTKGRHTDRGRRTGAFGTNCLDGLAMALHAIAATTSYSAAIERCVNMRGASNATGALCGQVRLPYAFSPIASPIAPSAGSVPRGGAPPYAYVVAWAGGLGRTPPICRMLCCGDPMPRLTPLPSHAMAHSSPLPCRGSLLSRPPCLALPPVALRLPGPCTDIAPSTRLSARACNRLTTGTRRCGRHCSSVAPPPTSRRARWRRLRTTRR